MVKLLVNQIKLGKITLGDVKDKYPKYYEDVRKALGL